MSKIILKLFFLFNLLDFDVTIAIKSYSFDEEIKSCNNGSKTFFDISNMKLTALNDTLIVFNGKTIVLKQISSPWPAILLGERYDRGQWNLMFQRKFNDFCMHILNPVEL